MPRPHRRGSATGIHHVMNRGVDHQPTFLDDTDRVELGNRLAAIQEAFAVDTLAYCLMGNHFHLVLRAPSGVLPEAMHHLTSVYSHRFNTRHHRDGPVFRGRYHSIPVETDAYLMWVTRYVHRNALDVAGVRTPRDYRWSSYRAYLGLRPTPSFVDRRPLMDLVGGHIDELAAITEDELPMQLRTVGELTHLVRCARVIEDVPESPIDRAVLVLLAHRTEDPDVMRLVETALGPRTADATRQAVRRAEARRCRDVGLARALEWVERQLAGA